MNKKPYPCIKGGRTSSQGSVLSVIWFTLAYLSVAEKENSPKSDNYIGLIVSCSDNEFE